MARDECAKQQGDALDIVDDDDDGQDRTGVPKGLSGRCMCLKGQALEIEGVHLIVH